MTKQSMGGDVGSALKQLFGALKSERDHLKVQLELGRMEAQDEWRQLEARWERFSNQVSEVGRDAEEEVRELGESLQRSYERMKRRLKDDD